MNAFLCVRVCFASYFSLCCNVRSQHKLQSRFLLRFAIHCLTSLISTIPFTPAVPHCDENIYVPILFLIGSIHTRAAICESNWCIRAPICNNSLYLYLNKIASLSIALSFVCSTLYSICYKAWFENNMQLFHCSTSLQPQSSTLLCEKNVQRKRKTNRFRTEFTVSLWCTSTFCDKIK